MQQPDQFISISYPQIDFLIPNDFVISAVGVKDVQVNFMHNQNSGIFDFDDIAAGFNQYPRLTHVKTLIVLRDENNNQVSVVTTQECKVCKVDLSDFKLFPDFYSEQFKQFGFLACTFEEKRMKLLIDIQQTIDYMNNSLLEVL